MTRIVEIIEKRGFKNANQVAKEAKLDSQVVYCIIDGTTQNPSFKTLLALSEVLNVTVGQLMGVEPLPADLSDEGAA